MRVGLLSLLLAAASLSAAASSKQPIQLAEGYYYISHIARASSPENDWKQLGYLNDRSVRLRDNSAPIWLVRYPDKTNAPNEFELQCITTGQYSKFVIKKTKWNWLELGPATTGSASPARFLAYFEENYGEAKGRFYIRSASNKRRWLGHTRKKVRFSRWRTKRVWQFIPSESVSHPTKLTTEYKKGLVHLPQAFDRFATSRDHLPGGYDAGSSSSDIVFPDTLPESANDENTFPPAVAGAPSSHDSSSEYRPPPLTTTADNLDLSHVVEDPPAVAVASAFVPEVPASEEEVSFDRASSETSIDPQQYPEAEDEPEAEEAPCFSLFTWPPAWWVRFINWLRGNNNHN